MVTGSGGYDAEVIIQTEIRGPKVAGFIIRSGTGVFIEVEDAENYKDGFIVRLGGEYWAFFKPGAGQPNIFEINEIGDGDMPSGGSERVLYFSLSRDERIDQGGQMLARPKFRSVRVEQWKKCLSWPWFKMVRLWYRLKKILRQQEQRPGI
jgi:hypothetical protein